MLTFTLAISCLTTSNLPWFMDLTFQVPVQYCSLQHRTLLLSPVTSTTGYCFCFGAVPSFFLELFLHWSPVAYWALNDLGSSSFSILSFCLFILFMGFSRQEYWSGLPFPSPVDHILLDLLPWPVCLGWPYMAWLSFSELDKAVVHVIRLASFLWVWFQCVCPLMPSRNTYCLTRDQIANIHWIMEKAREFQKNIYFCFIDYAKAFGCVDHNKLENSERDGNTRPSDLPLEKSVCRSGSSS